MTQQTITDRIKGWIEAGVTDNAELASLCGCTADYVRAIKKRIRDPAYDSHWKRSSGYYEAYNARRKERYATDLEHRTRILARDAERKRKRYWNDPVFRTRRLEAQALYRQKRREQAV